MAYTGSEPFPGLTEEQVTAIEEAIAQAPDPSWHDGIWRSLYEKLGEGDSYSDKEIEKGLKEVLSDLGALYGKEAEERQAFAEATEEPPAEEPTTEEEEREPEPEDEDSPPPKRTRRKSK